MSEDNPFSAAEGQSTTTRNDGDNLEPVPMDPVAILQRCWELMVQNPGTVAGAILLPLIPNIGFQVVQQGMQMAAENVDDDVRLGLAVGVLVVAIVGALVNLFFQLGTYRIFTRLARGLPADVSMLVGEGRHYLSSLGAGIVVGLAVTIGLLLLIVPGIILALGLQFTFYALIDQDLDPIAALQESWRLTDGYKGTVFVVNLVMGLLLLVFSCVTLGFGYLLAIPMMGLSQAVMYHSLLHLQPPRTV
jgi:hypothetical protein